MGSSRFQTHARGLTAPIAAYETLFELGRGGMGSVLLARALGAGGFERLVVIKRLHPHLLDLPEAVRRFLDEASLAACVQHANVVGTTQVGSDEDGYFLVLDYIEGGTLEELVDRAALRNERIPPPIVLRIALDALAGLSAVHEARDTSDRPLSILHRDVTLQNVIVGRDGVARIADFGIAKSAIASVSTDRNYLVGKLLYMPPEYLRRAPVGPTIDIYALGVTLWLALTARELWPEASEAQLVHHIVADHIPPLSSTGIAIAPQIEHLVARACDPEASRRFPTARDMMQAIEAIGRDTGWIATHGEVADFVEALMGVDLTRRREHIAELLSRPVTAAHRATNYPEPPAAANSAAASTTAPNSAEVPAGVPRRRLGPVLAIGGAVLALGAAAAVWTMHRARPDVASGSAEPQTRSASASSGTATNPAVESAAAAHSPAAESASPAHSAAAAHSAVAVRPPARRPAARRQAPRSTTTARTTAAPKTTATAGPITPPTRISTKNPYR